MKTAASRESSLHRCFNETILYSISATVTAKNNVSLCNLPRKSLQNMTFQV